MKTKSFVLGLSTVLLLACSARAQNYSITLYDQQNGTGNPILSYYGPMLTPTQNWTQIAGFVVFNPAPLQWTTPPITADLQPGVLNPCNSAVGNGGPNGEAAITCESSNNSNGLPLFSFCFLGAQWPIPVGTYNVDTANQRSCGNYFFASSQLSGYSSYAFLNNGSIVVVKNKTWTVTSLADDGSPGTLRYTIAIANSGDTIDFAVQGTITLTQGQLEISKNLTIKGPGASSLLISGSNTTRALEIASNTTFAISGVTIEYGHTATDGGGINNAGTLTISDSALTANVAGDNYNGGGISSTGTLTVKNCIFSQNSAGNAGGGIHNGGGTLIVTNSTFSTNSSGSATSGGSGGGIDQFHGTMTVSGSTFSGNSGGSLGGGILNNFGVATITATTVSSNSARYGAGMYDAGNSTILNATFSGNRGTFGGAIGTQGTLSMTNTTISGSSASIGGGIYQQSGGSLTVKNTIIASTSSGGNCNISGTAVSRGYNLSDDASCGSFFSASGDMNNTQAGLDPGGLKNNGGPTQTIAIPPSSPAFDVIPLSPTNYCTAVDGTPVTTDQRGTSRPQVSACDIGAFEYSSDDDSGLAQLNGGNTLTGNQTVSGAVSATSFVGSGAGLTNVNASSLGGIAASNYARLDIGNAFNGNQTVSGNVAANAFVGDGSALTGITAQTANTANFALSAGDAMTLGGNLPSAFAPASGSPSYVAKAGDTMTGVLNLPSNGLVVGTNQFALSGGKVGIGTASAFAALHVLNGTSNLPNIGDGNAVALFENNSSGAAANVWLDVKPASAGATDENYYFAVNGAGAGGLRYNLGGGYMALTTDTTPSGVNNEPFVLKGRSVGIGTTAPNATLDVNGTAKFSGLVTFAPGQTFPGSGSGTITGVTAGSGLSGGGSSGNVALSLNTNFTDARYLSLAGGTLTGSLTAPSFAGNGAGLTALNPANLSTGTAAINISGNAATSGIAANSTALGGVAAGNYARLDTSNNLNGTQSVSGDVSAAGTVSATNATFTGPLVPGFPGGVSTAGVMMNRKGGATSTQGFPSYPLALWASSFSSTTTNPVWNHIFQFVAEPTGNNTPNPSATMNLQFVSTNFPPTPNGYTFQETGFSVGTNGQTTTGALTINNGGTPITKHVSTTFNVSFQPLKPSTCIVMTFTLTGARDGDTLALGVPNALMTVGGIPAFFAWVSLPDQISVRACNMDPNIKQTIASSGVIRVDLWKH